MLKYLTIIFVFLTSCGFDEETPSIKQHKFEVYNLKCYSGGQLIFDKKVFDAYIGREYICFLNNKNDTERSCVTADCIGIFQGEE